MHKAKSLIILAAAMLACAGARAAHVEHGSLIYDGIPPAPAGLPESLAPYLNARQATPLGWSPSGQLLITTRFGDSEQLHWVDQPGGARRQVTFYGEPVDTAAVSGDTARPGFVFFKDHGGDERSQLVYQRIGEPSARLLTDGKSSNGGAVWSSAGRAVAFYSTARDGTDTDIYIVEPATGAPPKLVFTADSPGWRPLDWSPDDAKLLLQKFVSSGESYLYVLDIAGGQKRDVILQSGKAGITAARFSRDGIGIFMITDADDEMAQLKFVNLGSGERTLLSGHVPWDVEAFALSRDAHLLAYVSNEGGSDHLNLLDLNSHKTLPAPPLPPGLVSDLNFDRQSKRLAFGFSTAIQPQDAYVLDVVSNQVQPWTRSEIGAVDTSTFTNARLTEYPTFDRVGGKARKIPVYVYEPRAPGRHPVLIVLHGGPESQFRPGFDAWIQYAVNELGYTVVAPNVRGSSGFGKTNAALDNGVLREDAVKDVGALLVWLDVQPNCDAGHIVVSGSGYGGYLALAAMTMFGDRLHGGVDIAGISNFISFLTGTATYRRDLRRAEYGDERDPDMRQFLRRISPLEHTENITKPLLVVSGINDPRVTAGESEQLVNRLRARGGDVWYLTAQDEGHEFRKKINRDGYLLAFAQFLQRLKAP